MKQVPNISAFTYHSFKVKGRFFEVFYGTIIETFYGNNDRLKVYLRNWYNDEDVLKGLNDLIKSAQIEKSLTPKKKTP